MKLLRLAVLTAVIVAAGYTAHTYPQVAGYILGAPVGLCLIALVNVWRDDMSARSVTIALASIGCTGWLFWVYEHGLTRQSGWWLGGILAAAGVSLVAAPRHRVPKPRPVDAVIARWDEFVGGDRLILPGSRLVNVHPFTHGTEATIKLPPGVLTADDAVKAMPRIASAYEMPTSSLAVEPGGKASEARLLLVDDNPLARPVPFPGPTLRADGTYDLGRYVDGETVTARFWRPKYGAVHMLLAGTTGAGKSGIFSVVLANAVHSGGLVVPWVIDPQGGQSMPEWVDHVDWAATSATDGIVMLHAAHDVMMWRNRHMATVEWVDDHGNHRKGRSYFEPTEAMPLLSIVIDEAAQLLLDPVAVGLVASIAKMSRKCGIQLLLATQVPSADELGGNTTIRDQLAGGMAVVLRTGGRTSSQMMFSGMPIEPHKIEAELGGQSTAGLGFTVGANTRHAMMRAFYLSDRDAYELAKAGSPAGLDEGSAAAAGRVYLDRRDPDLPVLPVPVDASPVEAGAATAVTAVVDALTAAGGVARTGELVLETGYSRGSVANALRTLVADGTVTQLAKGEYRLG